jgi:hypothetical protein
MDPTVTGSQASKYLPVLGTLLGESGATSQKIWQDYLALPAAQQQSLALQIFSQVLEDGAASQTKAASSDSGKKMIASALASIFDGQEWDGEINLSSREIRTKNGGDISLFAPGGGLNLGFNLGAANQAPPGILTEHGGNISIFTNDSVDVGALRIFTLRGGNEIIWSTKGDIAAGRSSKTVQSAPPTQVLVDPQSANVQTDLAGLATGGGIGVLATVAGIPPADVDLIAPVGAIDAGDAGIRSTGNINLAARVVLNASNIQTGGTITGAPPPAAPPNIAGLAAASNTAAAASSSASEVAKRSTTESASTEPPSLITVEVLGYGGGEGESAAPAFRVTIEGRELSWDQPTVTVAELRALAGLPAGQAMEVENPDGSKRDLSEDEVISLPTDSVYRRK